MTSDDTKFDRARRERPHIEAFAQLKPSMPHPAPLPETSPETKPTRPRTWEEMRQAWNAYDQAHGATRPPTDRT